jgi:hypothetical protein
MSHRPAILPDLIYNRRLYSQIEQCIISSIGHLYEPTPIIAVDVDEQM